MNSRPILLRNANVLDTAFSQPVRASLLIVSNRIADVIHGDCPHIDDAEIVDCTGQTVMSGLCDAHAHLSWINSKTFDEIGLLPVEEHVLAAARNAKTYLDHGYTMCVGAAAGKLRLDVVIRNAIEAGDLPGPRFLANGPEISSTGSYIDAGPSHRPSFDFGLLADGPVEVRKQVRRLLRERVDLIKLGLSGEEIVGSPGAEQTIMTNDEVEAAATEAATRGVRVCAHARSDAAVRQCLAFGVQIIFHASFVTDETIEALAEARDRVFVVPSLSFIMRLVEGEGEPFGLPAEVAQAVGYAREVEVALIAMKKMKAAGIRLLPGGDYGFAWTPHGTYARDLEDFVTHLGFTPWEALDAATRLGGEIMGRPDELGRPARGYLADLLVVDGDPLSDVRMFQDSTKIKAVMKDGRFHRRANVSVH